MEFSVTHEAFVFVCSALCGSALFFVYDLFRLMKRKSGASRLMQNVQDAVFWLTALAISFFTVLYANNGAIRFYELIGALLGAVLYGFTLSPWILKLLDKILDIFSKIFKFFLKILLTPLLFMYNIMYRCIFRIFTPLRRLAHRLVRRLRESLRRTVRFAGKK